MKTTQKKPPIEEELIEKTAFLAGRIVQHELLQRAVEKLIGKTPVHLLMLAIDRGDSESFEAVLPFCQDDLNNDISRLVTGLYDPAATTLLGYAVSRRKTELCRRLIARGAKLKNQGELLAHTIFHHDWKTLRLLIKHGANVNATVINRDTKRKETLLHCAARHNLTEVMRILLANGANLRAKDKRGYNVLHVAAENCWLAATRMLVKAGIHINSRTPDGKTPLRLAVHSATHPGLSFIGTHAYLARVINFLQQNGGHE